MIRSALLGFTAAWTLASSSPAVAQDYSTNLYDIAETAEHDGCWLGANWEIAGRQPVHLEIVQTIQGELFAGLWSDGWSRPSEDLQKVLGVIFWGADGSREIFALFAVPTGAGLSVREKPGLYGLVEDDKVSAFRSAFSASQSFTVVSRDFDATEGTEFDTVLEGNLRGSAAAMTRLQSCVGNLARRTAAEQRREAAVAHIDTDPFRSEQPANEPGLTVLRNPEWSRMPAAEFPERALSRAIDNGRVALDCMANPNGSLTDCRIVSEDPAGAGFGPAALAGARLARLAPRAVDGAAQGARVHFNVSFTLSAAD